MGLKDFMTKNEKTVDPNTPQGFNIAGFISKATRPKDVAIVYSDGDTIGQMRKIARRIDQEKYMPEAVRDQRGAGEKSLRTQYAELWEKVRESEQEIWLQGHSIEETHEISGGPETYAESKKDPALRDSINLKLIAAAMVVDDGEVTVDLLRQLRNTIGEQQWKEIEHAYTQACAAVVTPSADFLPKPSTPDDGQE